MNTFNEIKSMRQVTQDQMDRLESKYERLSNEMRGVDIERGAVKRELNKWMRQVTASAMFILAWPDSAEAKWNLINEVWDRTQEVKKLRENRWTHTSVWMLNIAVSNGTLPKQGHRKTVLTTEEVWLRLAVAMQTVMIEDTAEKAQPLRDRVYAEVENAKAIVQSQRDSA